MQIKYHKEFIKNYKKRIVPNTKLVFRFQTQLGKFIRNPNDPSLKEHKLIGEKLGFRSFSVTGDIRVVYKLSL